MYMKWLYFLWELVSYIFKACIGAMVNTEMTKQFLWSNLNADQNAVSINVSGFSLKKVFIQALKNILISLNVVHLLL